MSICGGIAGKRNGKPKGIFIHNDAGSKNANAAYYKKWLPTHDKANGFAHAYVCSDGIVLAEDLDYMAWHCGQTDGNNNYLSMEVCQSMGDLEVFKQNEEKAFKLVAEWCKKYNIIPNASTIKLHREVKETACPHRSWDIHGRSVSSVKNYFISRIKFYLNGGTSQVEKMDVDGNITSGGTLQSQKDKYGEVSYCGHLREIGWEKWQSDGDMIGSIGQNRRIEAIKIKPVKHMNVTAHISDIGDKKYNNITKDTIIGTTGQNKRIEALMIESNDTVYHYRVHQKDIGWSSWMENGQWAGQKGKGKQIEAIEIKVVHFVVRGHIQDIGWDGWKDCGNTVGTTGKGKKLEAIQFRIYDGQKIEAKAHIENVGWMEYKNIDNNTIIGTTGKNQQIECLCFKGNFDWRGHVQGTGWTPWTKADGVSTMGTVGQSLRLEAIEFRYRK